MTSSPWLQVIQGNSNTHISEMRELEPPVIASRVRILPYSDKPKSVCMRLEVYGCSYLGELFCDAMV